MYFRRIYFSVKRITAEVGLVEHFQWNLFEDALEEAELING